jgi:SAM-dependent methyltransferase
MSQAASIEWWNKSLDEVGVRGMDKVLSSDATWEEALATGREDLARGMAITGLPPHMGGTVIEIGCGMGRMSAALAEHFDRVIGLDIAPRMVETARERNTNSRIEFEVLEGGGLTPRSVTECDAILSYEVLYYLPPEDLARYFLDAGKLLKSGGRFVFHINMEPLRLKTRAAFLLRRVLYACGIKEWRGWSTGAGLRRYYHSEAWLRRTLTDAGFIVDSIGGPSRRQTWVSARKA